MDPPAPRLLTTSSAEGPTLALSRHDRTAGLLPVRRWCSGLSIRGEAGERGELGEKVAQAAVLMVETTNMRFNHDRV
jgi:hypothetical protein